MLFPAWIVVPFAVTKVALFSFITKLSTASAYAMLADIVDAYSVSYLLFAYKYPL